MPILRPLALKVAIAILTIAITAASLPIDRKSIDRSAWAL
jgi:hypothetical protein